MQSGFETTYHGAEIQMTDTTAAEAALKAKLSRKRTKTGCLTCRKRRIKCGEERPVCNNCVKSKRHCEGYSQRVVFKQPTFDYQPGANGSAHITFQAGPELEQMGSLPPHHSLVDPAYYPDLRPRPAQNQFIAVWDQRTQQIVHIPTPAPEEVQQYPSKPEDFQAPGSLGPVSPGHIIRDPFSLQGSVVQNGHSGQHEFFYPPSASVKPSGQADHHLQNGCEQQSHHARMNEAIGDGQYSTSQHIHVPISPQAHGGRPGAETMTQHFWDDTPSMYSASVQTPVSAISSTTIPSIHESTGGVSYVQWPTDLGPPGTQGRNLPGPVMIQQNASPPQLQDQRQSASVDQGQRAVKQESAYFADWVPRMQPLTPEFYEQEIHMPANMIPTYVLSAAAIEKQDDDYYDVYDDESDQEQDIDTSLAQYKTHKRQRMLGRVLEGNEISLRGLQMRRYDTFLYEGILDSYRVEYAASPLKNPATARVFAHFISATGPSMSVFERTPNSSSVLFNSTTIPVSQQGLWTYTLPMAALHHQGLLHAMLALASLHIARLQGASTTPSMQHYAWALRRIHAAVSNPKSRLKVTTIAASMLLGFYEIMTADHMKWNMHLAGAKQLFVETDFVKMTSAFRRLKMDRAMALQGAPNHSRRYSTDEPYSQATQLDHMPDIDDRVVSQIVGKEVKYNVYGHIEPQQQAMPPSLDLSRFDVLRSLYWWYCKQDVIQSIVSGNALLMDFTRWTDCPPRAPLGRGDAVHGSFDHLVLLLGRIADFSSRDRKRKLKQIEANGGHWRPAPGMNISRAPQAQPQAPSIPVPNLGGTHSGAAPQMPVFYGMAPPPRANVHMPNSYTSLHQQTAASQKDQRAAESPEDDLSTATKMALQEHEQIREALDFFERSLLAELAFRKLESDSYHSTETAFGPTYFFRTYDIGCLWALYHMAVIIAIRAHPHMPPAAHMAAGVAAQETKHHAIEIGRIVAGIVPGPDDQPLNPTLGAALCESCLPSFFAAVQYQDPRQRYETVTRIFSIARRTGWGSAELIANGCETAWVKAAAAGRGPPYTRIVRAHHTNSEDPRLTGSWERLDPRSAPVVGDDADRRFVRTKKEARLNWAIGVMGVEEDVEKMKLVD